MNDNPWYPRYPAKYMTDTMAMEPLAECAYNRMIEWYYATGQPIPDDPSQIKLIGKIKDADWARIRGDLLTRGFFVDGGCWRHKLIDATLADMAEKRERRVKQTEAARRALAVTNPVTDSVTEIETDTFTATERELERERELEVQVQGVGDGKKPRQPSTMPDGEWLAGLAKNEAYQGINIQQELAKCSAWMELRKRKATRRAFLNWLNRIDKPIAVPPKYAPKIGGTAL